MPSFFDRFRRDGAAKSKKRFEAADVAQPPKLKWEEAWSRTEVQPEEVQKLIHVCTQEMKSRALDMPFLLLPFRPGLDPIGSKNFVRQYFRVKYEENESVTDSKRSEAFARRELRLMEPIVLCSIMKWCWARLPGGVVTWETYNLFKVAEHDSKMSKTAFDVFLPLSTESDARKEIIYDFFDLLAAVSARAKTNGLGGRKLSRFAGWWAFEHSDAGKGFDGGYASWSNAANATSHLFFAYLRSLAPEQTSAVNGISKLPRSLQALLSQTEYPPETPSLMQSSTTKVVMIVQEVSSTPFALLRRARNFEYREDDHALQEFSDLDDPIRALTDECRRVLSCISTTNQSALPVDGNAVQDPSWSRFEDMGFASVSDSVHSSGDLAKSKNGHRGPGGHYANDLNRPQTPSWADFLSSGFADDRSPTLLPPDKQLPLPVTGLRAHSSQSHRPMGEQADLEPGELASITRFDLDETFWWVWMASLAAEEPSERKSVFGRCALIETKIYGAPWLLIEEQVKGASPGQAEGVYLAEKKGLFSFTKRGRLGRRKTTKKSKALEDTRELPSTMSLNRISPEKHERLQAAASRLARGNGPNPGENTVQKRSRLGNDANDKTTSTMTVGNFMNEAGAALKWTSNYDSGSDTTNIRSQYLSDPIAGTGKTSRFNHSSSAVSLSKPVEQSGRKASLPPQDIHTTPKQTTNPMMRPAPPSPPRTPPPSQSRRASETTQFLPDEKIEPAEEHPALRNESVDSTGIATVATSAEPAAYDIRKISPKQEHRKLQKKEPAGPGGLKKLFGRKKAADERADTPTEHLVERIEEKPQSRGPASQPIVIPDYPKAPAPVQKPVSPARSLHKEPAFASVINQDAERSATAREEARRAALDRLQAEDEFSRFDQGPMSDMPSFVPADDEDEEDEDSAAPPPVIKTHATNIRTGGLLKPGADHPAPRSISPARKPIATQMRFPVRSADAPAGVQSSTTSDRWAQIRKNAAERAARLNEEQQHQQAKQHGRNQSTSARSDDGETSGEETIESRVARIKARVAELTGNMDSTTAPARVH